jgi:Zn-dependent peptidase ImmA (M78 family)/transcriptional regulator with XRE-family HTH domain
MATYRDLKELREHLGYRLDSVARLTHVSGDRLRAIEDEHAAPSVFELDELATLYGIEPNALADEPIHVSKADSIDALASLDEFRSVGDGLRARVVAVANAARDLVQLRKLTGGAVGLSAFMKGAPKVPHPKLHTEPHEQGAEVATFIRKHYKLGTGPLTSVRDFMTEAFPSVHILYADLTREGPAGLSFVDSVRGPTMVLNLKGKNALVRRFSLAHELCHLLVDWNRKNPLAQLSGYLTQSGLAREQRANAFAVRLLCPPTVIDRIRILQHRDADIAAAIAKYGVHYSAVRLFLDYRRHVHSPAHPSFIPDEENWRSAEEPLGLREFPFAITPPERRTLVATAAAAAFAAGKLSRDAFARSLGLTPADEVERVLDFFGLATPADAA